MLFTHPALLTGSLRAEIRKLLQGPFRYAFGTV